MIRREENVSTTCIAYSVKKAAGLLRSVASGMDTTEAAMVRNPSAMRGGMMTRIATFAGNADREKFAKCVIVRGRTPSCAAAVIESTSRHAKNPDVWKNGSCFKTGAK